jgi:hypothetical protein
MILWTSDTKSRFSIEIYKGLEDIADKLTPVVTFDIEDLDTSKDNNSKLIPEGISFNMTYEEAKELHGWLSVILKD